MTRATLRPRGQVTLPPDIRDALNAHEGDELEFEVTADGAVLVRSYRLVPSDQAWFWTDAWQHGEQEATDDIAAGRVTRHADEAAFLDSLR